MLTSQNGFSYLVTIPGSSAMHHMPGSMDEGVVGVYDVVINVISNLKIFHNCDLILMRHVDYLVEKLDANNFEMSIRVKRLLLPMLLYAARLSVSKHSRDECQR